MLPSVKATSAAWPARSLHTPACAVELDRLLPATLPVGERAEVVEHAPLLLGIAELAVDLERARRVGRLLEAPELEQRPVERVGRARLGAQLAARLALDERLAAEPLGLAVAALALADPREVGDQARAPAPRRLRPGACSSARSPRRIQRTASRQLVALGDLAAAEADPGLRHRVIDGQPPRRVERALGVVVLADQHQHLAE